MEENQAEFLSFCIESYKAMMGGLSGMKIANFFEEFGVFDYLLENYGTLHQLERNLNASNFWTKSRIF